MWMSGFCLSHLQAQGWIPSDLLPSKGLIPGKATLSVFGLQLCETVKVNIMFPWKTINSFGFGSRRFVM